MVEDLTIHREGDRARWLSMRVATPRGPRRRVVVLRELTYLPIETRDDPDLLGRQWAAVRGLYNAGVDFVYAAAGIYSPTELGVVQYYGAAAEAETESAAVEEALRRAAAVEAVLANNPQARLEDPRLETLSWLVEFLQRRQGVRVLALLGHPDPRLARRGLGRDPSLDEAEEDLASQQNELLFRGLARLREDFVFLVTAAHVARRRLAEGLVRVAEAASAVASRRRGAINVGFSVSLPLLAAIAGVHGGGHQQGEAQGETVADGVGQSWGRSESQGRARTESMFSAHTRGRSWGEAVSRGQAESVGRAESRVSAITEARGAGQSASMTRMESDMGGIGVTIGPEGVAAALRIDSRHTEGQAFTTSQSTFQSRAVTEAHGVTESQVQTRSQGESQSQGGFVAVTTGRAVAETVSRQEGRHEAWSRSHSEGQARSAWQGRSGFGVFGGGFSAGVVPGASVGRSWEAEDDVADRLTEVLRGLEGLLNRASAEGGFLTEACIFTASERGERAAAALAPQAFHGPNVPTPVLTVPIVEGAHQARERALAFRLPQADQVEGDPFAGLLWAGTATLLTAGQLAAYTAPGLFEESSALTVQERLPPLAFYPSLEGEVVLGHQVSPETGDLTDVPLRLSRARHFHTAFTGDTGYGKSVAAMRLAYESTLHWRLRTIVLDFGAGWRALLNAPGLEGRVDIYQLWPGSPRPLRWNPLQIGTRIAPEIQWRAFCDVFGAIARLGVRRQVGELRDALRQIYVETGALVDDPEVRGSRTWGVVRRGEEAIAGAVAGTPLGDLTPEGRQALAVARSRRVGLADLYARLRDKFEATPPRDQILRGVLEGILYRMHPLVEGAAAAQYAPGVDTVDLAELARPWGVVILEGGAFLDAFSKAFLLGWAAWHIYTDAVVRRIRGAAEPEEQLQIFFEEANKVLSGVDYGDTDDGGGAAYTAEQFAHMWRDGRKYGVWLHVISQSPSLLPRGILSSCDNLIAVQLKNPRDRDLVTAAIARSEKGFVDEAWRRFLARLPIGRAVARLGYSYEIADQEPVLFRPLMLQAAEPTDAEVAEILGGRRAA